MAQRIVRAKRGMEEEEEVEIFEEEDLFESACNPDASKPKELVTIVKQRGDHIQTSRRR